MNRAYEGFLRILKAAIDGREADLRQELTPEEWGQIIGLAQAHSVLPLVCQAAHGALAAAEVPNLSAVKSQARQYVMLQTMKSHEFLRLNRHLQAAGIRPLVVKGLVCRNLYPQPDQRMSSDEDLLIPDCQMEACHDAMLAFGLGTQVQDRDAAYEVPYRKPGSPLYIELHKSLFPPESQAYGDWNRFFEGAFDRAIPAGDGVFTLSHTDHLFYLICHAFKHFLHSGFGIRQVCDIVMYANAYGTEVDWDRVYDQCGQIHAEVFAAALFRIGRKYLTFDPEQAAYPVRWQQIQVDETAMLEDLLTAGVYGGATMSRRHSSNMTLDAVAAEKKGKKASASLRNTLFPSAKSLQGRYPYLKKHPYLLPAAWAARIVKYGKRTRASAGNTAAQTLKIGSQRVELLRQYGVIK